MTFKEFLESGITREDIVNYYNNNLLIECASYFGLTKKVMTKVFKYYDIPLRSKSDTNKLINDRKLAEKINYYTKFISREDLRAVYYINNRFDCINILGIDSINDLHLLVNYYNLDAKTYSDREISRKNTLNKLYNVDNNFQREDVKTKIAYYNNIRSEEEVAEITNKIKATKLERYGDENYNNPDKVKRTILHNFGSKENFVQHRKEATIITNNKKYGADWYSQTDAYKESYKNTCNEKYNCDYFCQSEQYIKSGRKSYFYNNLYFDSSWELALYLYAIAHNEEIIRSPLKLEYYVNNKKHYYFPDFKYKGMLIEIKGDHMLDENNNLKDGYNSGISNDHLKAKQECMYNNNVILLSKKDIKFALDWCKDNNIDLKLYKV